MSLDRTIQVIQVSAVLAIALLSCQNLPAGDRTAGKSEPAANSSPLLTMQQKALSSFGYAHWR